MKKGIAVGIIALFIVSAVSPMVIGHSADMSSLSEETIIDIINGSHPPIYIDGNDDFTSENGVTGGSGWNIETVDSNGNVGRESSLVLDSNEMPHISYFNRTNYSLKYARWTGTNWNIKTIDSPVSASNSLALDSNGRPHIAYMYKTSDYENCLKYAKWNGSEWEIEIVDSEGNAGWGVSLALDSNNSPYMIYSANDEYFFWEGDLRFAWLNDTTWEKETLATHTDTHTSIAIDSNNEVHIAYEDGNLKYAKKGPLGWKIYDVDLWNRISGSISLTLDSKNNPHISYALSVSPVGYPISPLGGKACDNILKYACRTNDSWDVYIVDNTIGKCGFKNCIALDSNDKPFISYSYSYENRIFFKRCELRFASFVNDVPDPYWITCLIDEGKDQFGYYNSLVFDSDDNPHISFYRDYNIGGLMYANRIGTLMVSFEKPKRGRLYKFNNLIPYFFNGYTIILGRIKFSVTSNKEIQKVEFYIDDKLKSTDISEPYEWMWWGIQKSLRHNIRAVAYDNDGNSASDKIWIWKFF